ncbi:hypothetical protein BDM02DRAFT_3117573 [Thelephora ganbajun]|uniref:Uncharacterized protein n=1 Tax=Thelephora ganbajun TaxID=370292 RepID=A0ACB6ZBZ9_THEGA|nr:hypothetical protein BDM02DRAFT_3117573 [Thelephora ganbajun]
MMISSKAFTSLVIDAPCVDPKQLETLVTPQSTEALVAAIHEAFPILRPRVDDFAMYLDLISDDGSSQSSNSPSYSYDYPFSPQHGHIDCGSLYSPTTSASSPSLSAARTPIEATCAGGWPIKQKGGGYRCSNCDKPFKRRDDAKRHIDSTGMQVVCKYCGRPSSGRRDGQRRHLLGNKNCLKAWNAGFKAGLFTERSVEDAYN